MSAETLRRERPPQRVPMTETAAAGGKGCRPLRVLFVLNSLGSLRYFQSTLELLTQRGHQVRLLLEERRGNNTERRWVKRMVEHENFACDVARGETDDPWEPHARSLRAGMEYVHFLGPVYRERTRYAQRATRRASSPLVYRLAQLPLIGSPRGLRALHWILRGVARALPIPASAVHYVERRRPDVVVVSVRGSRTAAASIFTRVSKRVGIPVLNCVASWDNLSTRPQMVELPHQLLVWNDTQVQEAVELHGVPEERVVVTGAPNFDDWFEWRPRPAEEFLSRVGLDPERPVILWVGTALNPGEPPEREFVSKWIGALRSAGDRPLRDVGVLVRPHPARLKQWEGLDLGQFENAAVWPRTRLSMPVEAEQKADFYDSIFHSRAVVGINTSAMIEASIIGRPVLTVVAPEHHHSQLGTLHFSYLLDSNGGVLRLARSMDEHLADLRSILGGADEDAGERARRFVSRFVRPHGLDRPATPILVEAMERAARAGVAPEPDPLGVVSLRALLVLADRMASMPKALPRLDVASRARWRRAGAVLK